MTDETMLDRIYPNSTPEPPPRPKGVTPEESERLRRIYPRSEAADPTKVADMEEAANQGASAAVEAQSEEWAAETRRELGADFTPTVNRARAVLRAHGSNELTAVLSSTGMINSLPLVRALGSIGEAMGFGDGDG